MLKFRTAGDIDIWKVLEIRNNPEVMKGYYTQKKPIERTEHMSWWYSRNTDWTKFMIEEDDTVIGMANIGQQDYWEPELAISLLPQYWGKGYGKQIVEEMCSYLRVRGYKYTRTTILDNNERSIRLFTSVGFKRMCEARPLESLYRKIL